MIPSLRTQYNRHFTAGKYAAFLHGLATEAGEAPAFKIAETPVFIPAALTHQLVQAGETVIDLIVQPNFKYLTRNAIPPGLKVPNENDHPHFLIIDYAICKDENGALTPELIELQGFPSLYALQELMARQFRQHFNIPDAVTNFFNGLNADSYFQMLHKVIVGNHAPENVVLLEIKPREQKTSADFSYTEKKLGIHTVCATELIQQGKQLFYKKKGRLIRIERIYNRLIFDDLQRQAIELPVNLFQELEVEWITHPNWFYRISKYALPLLQSACWFLHELPVIPADLENYVLKPLFSFAGKGVMIDVTKEDIEQVKDPENWILQRKVTYAPAIATPEGPAFCEIRLMYLWPDDAARPQLVHNLARISKSKMIGVTQDKTHTWIGGTCAFFE